MFQNNLQHTGLYSKPGNNPPEKPNIDGPLNGKVGVEHIFSAISTDPEGDDVSYLFKWGDLTDSGWTDYVSSETMINVSHKWWFTGTYTVKVKAKDCHASQSEWAEIEVTMPKNKMIYNSFIARLLEHFTLLERLISFLNRV
jgi:hypothetical protein